MINTNFIKKIKKLLCLLVFIIFQTTGIISQNSLVIDSLLSELNKADDTTKIKIYNSLCWEYRNFNYSLAIQYGKKALLLAEDIHFYKETGTSLSFIGVAYRNLGNYPKALEYYLKALQRSIEEDNQEEKAYSLINIGNFYLYLDDNDMALKYVKQAFKIAEQLKIPKLLSYCYVNLGRIYNNNKEYDKARDYLSKTLVIRKQINDTRGIAVTLYDIADIYKNTGDYEKSLDYLNKSINILKKIGDKDGILYCYNNIACVYFLTGDNDISYKYALIAYEIAKNINSKFELQKTCKLLAEIYEKRGDYKKSCEYQKQYVSIKDSIFKQEKILKLAQLESKNEIKEHETQIEVLLEDKKIQKEKVERIKLFSMYLLIGLIFIVIFVFILYRNIQQKKKIFTLLLRQKEEIERQRDMIDAERRKSEELILNIIPKEIAKELKEKGFASTKSYDMVTVVFADLVGFSEKSENLSPDILIEELNHCFFVFDEITEKFNLEKIKTIGDAYMCAGGIPLANKTNPMDAILAGIKMQEFMNNWKTEKIKRGESYWEMRIGIHTGSVVAGVIGMKKFAYDIWGDTVNIASRMESASEPGRINISGSTYELIKNNFFCHHRGKISAKNMGEIDMYFVEKEK
ncbi:MAG: tetratricopeptide repeat protein [Bacteroidales bacterium]|nr:tetratricopeptide repeat protein [Bacteroidales bacterium]